MDKFWKWMEEKGYCQYETHRYDIEKFYFKSGENHNEEGMLIHKMSKQMLIGYMFEYLIERNIKMTKAVSIPRMKGSILNKIKPSVRFEFDVEKIADIYNYLKKELKIK